MLSSPKAAKLPYRIPGAARPLPVARGVPRLEASETIFLAALAISAQPFARQKRRAKNRQSCRRTVRSDSKS